MTRRTRRPDAEPPIETPGRSSESPEATVEQAPTPAEILVAALRERVERGDSLTHAYLVLADETPEHRTVLATIYQRACEGQTWTTITEAIR